MVFNKRAIFCYDGTFDGFLSLVFEAYHTRTEPESIQQSGRLQQDFFTPVIQVLTKTETAGRVWSGLSKRLSAEAHHSLFQVFLSEQAEVEMLLFRYIRLLLSSESNMEQNYAEPCVLQMIQLSRRVWREKHRMEAFVRFRKMADGTFFAVISPDFNVLPLISEHFQERYADQQWLIYDRKRHYGIRYNLHDVEELRLDLTEAETVAAGLNLVQTDPTEQQFQELWQCYFASVNIPERRNPKLHLRHVPKRYWRYLTEKQPGTPASKNQIDGNRKK